MSEISPFGQTMANVFPPIIFIAFGTLRNDVDNEVRSVTDKLLPCRENDSSDIAS